MIARQALPVALAMLTAAACGLSSQHAARPASPETPSRSAVRLDADAPPAGSSTVRTHHTQPVEAPSAVPVTRTESTLDELDAGGVDLDHTLADIDKAEADAAQTSDG